MFAPIPTNTFACQVSPSSFNGTVLATESVTLTASTAMGLPVVSFSNRAITVNSGNSSAAPTLALAVGKTIFNAGLIAPDELLLEELELLEVEELELLEELATPDELLLDELATPDELLLDELATPEELLLEDELEELELLLDELEVLEEVVEELELDETTVCFKKAVISAAH